jgi:hypothetical protein
LIVVEDSKKRYIEFSFLTSLIGYKKKKLGIKELRNLGINGFRDCDLNN